MIWGAVSYYGTVEVEGVKGTMDARGYCELLEKTLLPAAADVLGENWTLMHDGASVHRANYTKNFLEEKNVKALDWPAKSPDLNVIENVWGQMARRVYAEGRHFESLSELGEAIGEAWDAIDLEYLPSLYKSIPRRLVSVIEKKGATTKY